MDIKKIIVGEPMPDKDDPKYKERYEREVEAGRKFAEKTRLAWMFMKLQLWANNNKKAFLVIVFGIVISLFALNILNMVSAYKTNSHTTAVEKVDAELQKSLHSNKNR